MSRFKIGDVVVPVENTLFHQEYGNFVAEVVEFMGDRYIFKVIEEGKGVSPVTLRRGDFYTGIEAADVHYKLHELCRSPLWEALS